MCQSDEVESLCHLQSLRGISLEMLKHLMKESPRTNNKDKSSVFTFPCFDLNNAKYLPDAVKRPCHFYIAIGYIFHGIGAKQIIICVLSYFFTISSLSGSGILLLKLMYEDNI